MAILKTRENLFRSNHTISFSFIFVFFLEFSLSLFSLVLAAIFRWIETKLNDFFLSDFLLSFYLFFFFILFDVFSYFILKEKKSPSSGNNHHHFTDATCNWEEKVFLF